MNVSMMVDIETLGQGPNSVILSVGAVAFDREAIAAKKEWFLNVEQQQAQGRKIDYQTLQWWNAQPTDARQIFHIGVTSSLTYFCNEFNAFFTMNCGSDGKVWGNGASFDIPILESLIKRNSMDVPWKFWNHRCYRTVKAMFAIEQGVAFEGVKHGALADALHQAKCLQKLFKERPELEK